MKSLQSQKAELERRAAAAPLPPSFAGVLRREHITVIAEIKRASPSKGAIGRDIHAAARAADYAAAGASAISVLTEPNEFRGSLEDLEAASTAVSIPLLRKDFIVGEEQILEARAAGASAVLLIARALAPHRLAILADFARRASVEPLIEVRTPAELDQALAARASVVGINARDLETLEIDPTLVSRLAPRVPTGMVCVAESGIHNRSRLESMAAAGIDAALIGSALSEARDARAAVREFTGVRRKERAAAR